MYSIEYAISRLGQLVPVGQVRCGRSPVSALALASALLLVACGGGGSGTSGSGSSSGSSSSGSSSSGGSSGSSSSGSSSGSSSSSSGGSSSSGTSTDARLRGTVAGGQSALVGSVVTLYAVGSGGPAVPIATTTSDANGSFGLDFTCASRGLTPATLVYVTATGGNSGSGNNSAIKLISALGQCEALPATVMIDEFTTVADAYALSGFIDTDVRASSSNGAGIANAYATAAVLADAVSGSAPNDLPTAAARQLNTLANALSTCIASGDGASARCTELFQCALPGAGFNGGACSGGSGTVSDTLGAALSVVHHAGTVAIAGIYDSAPQDRGFTPMLAAAPNDWTLSLNFTGGGLNQPTQAAIDAAGNVWLANYNKVVSEFSPTGVPVSAAGYTGGGLNESFAIAIDGAGKVWVANEQGAGGVNSGHGSITRLSASGSIESGASGFSGAGIYLPEALAIDANGQVWIANSGNSSLSALSSTGAAVSPGTAYTGGGLSVPQGIAVDDSGDLWLSNTGADRVSEFSPAGMALSPAAGYTGGGLKVPQAVAIDQQGNVWLTNAFGDSVTELNAQGSPVRPSAYSGAGLNEPGGIAVDGAGNIWISNDGSASISELAGAAATTPGAALSPAGGFTATGLNRPFAPAIDSAGNVWVGNFAGDSVTELIGAAVPVKTPLIGPPRAP